MHLFARCDLVKEFWENFKRWLTDKINTTLEINDKNILFSSFSKSSLINYLTILAKYYIYKNKFYTQTLNILGFELYVKSKFENGMYISKLNNTFDKFLGKWSSLFHYFMAKN